MTPLMMIWVISWSLSHSVMDIVPRLGARGIEWNGSCISIVFSSHFYNYICLYDSRSTIGDASNSLRNFLVFLEIS